MNRLLLIAFVLVVAGGIVWTALSSPPPHPESRQHESYVSPELGLSFYYPKTYEVTLHTEGNAERRWYTLVLLPDEYIPPQGGEGPPSIAISAYDNVEGLPLEQWIRGDARSNFKLPGDQLLKSTTIDGEAALKYQYSGLYETDAVAVAHGGRVYVFSAGWLTPQDVIRAEFQDLYSSVNFTQ